MSEFQVNVNFNYSVKVPAELKGGPQYASEEFGGSISLGQKVEAETQAEAQEAGRNVLPFLAQQVKGFVIHQAGLEQITDDDGVIQPVLQAQVVAAPMQQQPYPTQGPAAQPPAQVQQAAPMQQMAQQGTQGKAGFDNTGQPLWEGRPVKVYDNRAQVGTPEHGNKPHVNLMFMDVGQQAPPSVKYKGFWPVNKDGSPSKGWQEIQRFLSAAPAPQVPQYPADEAPF